jgi:glycosyltransferase involved in cell wall biosynthesis
MSDVFVFPTLGEGFALVILEALSCGVPCIVSDMAGGNDAIQDGYNGFEIQAGNDTELKEKIQWFLDNMDLLPKMSNNSRESSKYYTWERYFEGVASSVKQFLSE